MKEKSTDDEWNELRRWMDDNIRGLRDDRSTASYALEFLWTTHRNLRLASERNHLQIMLSDARKIVERIPDVQDKCLELEKNQSTIPWREQSREQSNEKEALR